jgi:hypothetical protein
MRLGFYAVKIHTILMQFLIIEIWSKINGLDCFVLILLKCNMSRPI